MKGLMQHNGAAALDQAWLRFWCAKMESTGHYSLLEKYLVQTPTILGDKPPPIIKEGDEVSRELPPKTKPRFARGLGDRVAEFADDFLSTITTTKWLGLDGDSDEIRQKVPYYDGRRHLENVDFYLMGNLNEQMLQDPDLHILVEQDAREVVEAFWPVDFAMVTHFEENERADYPQEHFALNRIVSLNAKDVRGMTRITPSHVGLFAHGRLFGGDIGYSETELVGVVGAKWTNIENERMFDGFGRMPDPIHNKEINAAINVMFGTRLSARYYWHVAFGSPFGARLVLPTSPRGCLVLFRSRDKAPGAARRDALKHWVAEFYRERRSDAGVLDYVRNHLRGATHFRWNGIDCELLVSEFDLERNEFFKREAAQWRAFRKHNRVKVRLKEKR